MRNPCNNCSFDETRCPLHGHCKAKRIQKEALINKHSDDEYLAYRRDRKTDVLRSIAKGHGSSMAYAR